jgi:hypothetical protein
MTHNFKVENIYMWVFNCKENMQKIPYLGWWPSVHGANFTPLYSPMLKIDCPLSHKPLGSPLLPNLPPFPVPHTHTRDTALFRVDDTSTTERSSSSDIAAMTNRENYTAETNRTIVTSVCAKSCCVWQVSSLPEGCDPLVCICTNVGTLELCGERGMPRRTSKNAHQTISAGANPVTQPQLG